MVDSFLMFSGVYVFLWGYPLLSTSLTIIPTITHDNPYFDYSLMFISRFSTGMWIRPTGNRGIKIPRCISVVFLYIQLEA